MSDEQRLAENVAANETFVKRVYPNEKFISTTNELKQANRFTEELELPKNVRLAWSRIPKNKGEQERLAKELRQAGILTGIDNNSVFLTPEPGKYKQQSPDAVLNGIPFEFRNVTGKDEKVERRFSQAKEKGDHLNVYLNIDTDINVTETLRRIKLVLDRHPEYTGKIVISWRGGKPSFFDTVDLV